MSGWEAMQQGAPDPFFAEGRKLTEGEADEFWGRGEIVLPETVYPETAEEALARQRQILGSGREDFTTCAACHDDICALAKACVRSEARL